MAAGVEFARGLPLAIALVSCPSAAWAADASPAPSARLVWVRGENTEGCSDGTSMARRVSTRLGKNAFREDAPTSIEGVIEREGQRWVAHLYIRGADGRIAGTRLLTSDGPDCDALDAAATLAVALAIDPEAALRPTPVRPVASSAEPTPALETSTLAAPPPPASAIAPTASPGPAASHNRGATEGIVRGLLATGLLPQASFGVALSTGVAVSRVVHVTTGALYLPEIHSGAEFAFGLTAGSVGGCVHPWSRAVVGLSFCGEVLLGAIHSVVFVLEPAQPGDRLWVGAALSAQAGIRVLWRI